MATSTLFEQSQLAKRSQLAEMAHDSIKFAQEIVGRTKERLDRIDAVVADFQTAAGHINNGGRFTEVGRAQEVKALASRENERLDRIETEVREGWDKLIAQLEATSSPSPVAAIQCLTICESERSAITYAPNPLPRLSPCFNRIAVTAATSS